MLRASGLRGYRRVMRELGEDPLPLLQRYGIAPAALDNDDSLISLASVCALLEYSSDVASCDDLGLRISQKQDISTLGALGLAMQSAPTRLAASQIAGRYLFSHSPGLTLTVLEKSSMVPNAIELSIAINLDVELRRRQAMELCLGTAHQVTRQLNPDNYRLITATIPHKPLSRRQVYRDYFGAKVQVETDSASLHFDSDGWTTPLPGGNPVLKQIAEDYLIRHYKNPTHTNTQRVRSLMREMLGTPQANRNDIADMLAVHPRTLHRRLQAEGTTFHQIKDELRQELAVSYLRDTEVSMTQLSDMLGFPEQSAFSRAFRRWFNKPPSDLRKHVQA